MSQFILNLKDGLVLLVLGMGFVFAFLYIMVLVMNVMSKFIKWLNKFFPEEVEIIEKKGSKPNVSQDEAIVVAIAVAASRSRV